MEENRTLLIVDDEVETLKGYQEFLTPKPVVPTRRSSRRLYGTGPTENQPVSEEYRLLSAQSGEEALKIFEKELKQGNRIAAGFFDVKMGGGMDGLATIHAIKAMDKDIHCVVVTAYQDRSVEEINQIFGEDFKDQWDYLNKPFTQGEIVQKARQMVSAWNRKRHIESITQQLIRSERLASVGQVAKGVGHEFGNILQRIMGKVDLALLESDLSKVQEHLKVVLKASERAGVIVRNLQSFTKPEPVFQFESLTVPIEESLSLVGHELSKCSIEVEKDFQDTPKLKMDVGGIAQVLLNLFINASHAMAKGGKIKVTIEKPLDQDGKKWTCLKVTDTGSGIREDVLPRIFDFAYSTKGDGGSGLGLAVSKQIIEAHGGVISVKTEVGKGSEFSILLPISGEV
jgi:signal transduction histidine kinase